MKIRDIAEVIERYAPLRLQESYDNAGLIVGRPEDEVHQALLAVDVTHSPHNSATDSEINPPGRHLFTMPAVFLRFCHRKVFRLCEKLSYL